MSNGKLMPALLLSGESAVFLVWWLAVWLRGSGVDATEDDWDEEEFELTLVFCLDDADEAALGLELAAFVAAFWLPLLLVALAWLVDTAVVASAFFPKLGSPVVLNLNVIKCVALYTFGTLIFNFALIFFFKLVVVNV